MAAKVPNVTLNNSVEMPILGFGVYQIPPDVDLAVSETLGDSAVYSEGQGGTFVLTLESGKTYGVICFLSDREGGPPHVIAHQMAEIFTVE